MHALAQVWVNSRHGLLNMLRASCRLLMLDLQGRGAPPIVMVDALAATCGNWWARLGAMRWPAC